MAVQKILPENATLTFIIYISSTHLTSKLNSKTISVLPFLDPSLIFPFHLIPFPVKPTGMLFCNLQHLLYNVVICVWSFIVFLYSVVTSDQRNCALIWCLMY